MRIWLELDTLSRHLLDAAVDEMLLHLKIGDAVAQQASDAIALFEKRHPVAGARQLLRGGKPRGTGAHHGHALAGPGGGRLGPDPTLPERVIDDGLLNLLDGYRRLVDAEHAGGLARGRANTAGEFRKIVGRMQHADGFAPAAAINQIVPVGNDIVQRTAGVAKRHAAVHAPRALFAKLLFWKI